MRIALLQYNPKFGAVAKNVDRAIRMLSQVDFDLAVLPELFSTGYLLTSKREVAELSESVPKGPTCSLISAFCKIKKVFIAFGIMERTNRKFYNSAVLMGPRGMISHYRKLHLFQKEKKWFSPGNLPLKVVRVKNARVGMMICFDWRFPEVARKLSLQGADIILHPSNLVLPHGPFGMQTRALENGVFCAVADRTGVERRGGTVLEYIGQSRVIAPDGSVLAALNRTKEKVLVVSIDPTKARNKKLDQYNDIFKDRRPNYY